jgi:two-component system LytT family sensor kinase
LTPLVRSSRLVPASPPFVSRSSFVTDSVRWSRDTSVVRSRFPDASRLVALARIAVTIVLLWLCAGVFLLTKQTLVLQALPGFDLPEIAAQTGLFIAIWSVATPVIVHLSRKFPIRRPRAIRNAVILALLSIAGASLMFVVVALLAGATASDFSFDPQVVSAVYVDLFPIFYIALVTQHLDQRAANARRRRDESELQAELANIELQQLRAALDPHFLFNALNAVLALIPRAPDKARAVAKGLGELLSRSVQWQGRTEIELEEEIRFVNGYLEIQRARFGAALMVSIDVAPETLRSLVPPLLVQTLVENAVIHGLRSDHGRGAIQVRAARSGDAVRIEVTDSGPGFDDRLPSSGGIGIANVRARLRLMHGNRQSLTFRKVPGGFVAAATLPSAQRAN